MQEKYFEALCVLSEILIDNKNELSWKDIQLKMKDEEIAKLNKKIDDIEQYLEKVGTSE